MSLSGPDDPLLGRLLDVAEEHGITIVAAFDPALPGGGFPASHSGVVAVVDEGSEATVAGIFGAPGRDIPTTQPHGGWFFVNGSSFAAAHVSGLFALLRERNRRPPVRLGPGHGGRQRRYRSFRTLLRVSIDGQGAPGGMPKARP